VSDRPVPVPRTGVALGITDPREKAREELKAALAAIEIKANLPRRIEHGVDRAVRRARGFQRENPAGAAAAVVAVAATVGGLVWLAVRAYTR
jgi:hypothetical protein